MTVLKDKPKRTIKKSKQVSNQGLNDVQADLEKNLREIPVKLTDE